MPEFSLLLLPTLSLHHDNNNKYQ